MNRMECVVLHFMIPEMRPRKNLQNGRGSDFDAFLLMATPPWSLNLQTSPSFKHDMRITYLVRSRWVELVLQHEGMEGERTRERERVRANPTSSKGKISRSF